MSLCDVLRLWVKNMEASSAYLQSEQRFRNHWAGKLLAGPKARSYNEELVFVEGMSTAIMQDAQMIIALINLYCPPDFDVLRGGKHHELTMR